MYSHFMPRSKISFLFVVGIYSIKFVKFKTAKCNTRLAEPYKSSILYNTNFCRKHFSIKNAQFNTLRYLVHCIGFKVTD